MNSCLYECQVMHSRMRPKKNVFQYKVFTFLFDLDELSELKSRISLLSFNRWNVFSLYDRDHLSFGKMNLRENIEEYLRQNGFTARPNRILLLTYPRIFGYTFNPVSFYFCLDENGETICIVPEVNNTFGEQKPYLLTRKNLDKNSRFHSKEKKYFYVSPFIGLESEFEFYLNPPGEVLDIRIDSIEDGMKTLVSTFTGRRKEMSSAVLVYFLFRYPFVTLKVITLIHYQAFKLFLKKIPFIKKDENKHLQRGVHLGKSI